MVKIKEKKVIELDKINHDINYYTAFHSHGILFNVSHLILCNINMLNCQ